MDKEITIDGITLGYLKDSSLFIASDSNYGLSTLSYVRIIDDKLVLYTHDNWHKYLNI